MGARHRGHPASRKDVLPQPLRTGNVGQAPVEDGLHQRVAARDDVADDEHIGLQRDLLRAPAFRQVDALSCELCAHGRIDVGVAPGHAVPCRSREERDAAHERAADAEDVQVHGEVLQPMIADSIGLASSGPGSGEISESSLRGLLVAYPVVM